MTEAFQVGIEFDSVLTAISKQIYDTPLAFLRENVQNAVDAIRIHSIRPDADLGQIPEVRVTATPDEVVIQDNGIGMTRGELQNLFWTIGASGKRTQEARNAGCVGMFGIGGFANFGVCSALAVTSQPAGQPEGHETSLSRDDIEGAGGGVPKVTIVDSTAAAPRGTIVRGTMEHAADVSQLREYLEEFVKYAQEYIYFNDELISRQSKQLPSEDPQLTNIGIGPQDWSHGNTMLRGSLYEGPAHTLHAELTDLWIDGEQIRLTGRLRFENGAIDVLKRGFKLCATVIGTQIGVSGTLDCDGLSPTAGRDSLEPKSGAIVAAIAACMERAAVDAVLESTERIAQHTRIFRYVRSNGLVDSIGKTRIDISDGSEMTLSEIQSRRIERDAQVFYSTSRNARLAHLLQTRGSIVVQLPSDRNKSRAVVDFLSRNCGAQPLDGRVECVESYTDLTRFERLFMAELEETILGGYELQSAELIPGRLSEDVPVYASDAAEKALTIFVDVRHTEISKLEALGVTNLFRSLVSVFCREYLGPALKAHSPKFFGSGAINLDFLSKRRSELWVLMRNDIEVLTHGVQRDVVRPDDVQVVHAGGDAVQPNEVAYREPKLVRIVGNEQFASLFGYYLRIPKSANTAYGDVIQQLEDRAAIWVGDKITLFASDGISTAFLFDVRLDQLISTADGGSGATEILRPVQALFNGRYFPIPQVLEGCLVPFSTSGIRIEVRCEWTDYSTARSWEGAT